MKNTRISAALVAVILMGMAPSAYAAVNTAPVLDATKSPSLNGVAEDTGAPSSGTDGTPIFSLVDAAAPAGQADNVTDPDPFVQFGIAITAVDTSHYTAWYVYDGATWTSFSGVSESNALLLPANASYRIYGVPAANVSGSQSSAITFRAWDQTSGTSGTTADTTTNGGSTAFSTSTDTISQYISGVNDAPTLDFSRSPQLTSLTEDSGVPTSATDGTLISTLVDFVAPSGQVDNVTDPDPSAALGIAVTHLATAGIAYWYVYDGTNWSLAPTVSTTNALLLPADGSYRLCAVPQANVTGTINAVTFRAWDQTSGTAGSTADTTTNGGTTAFSSAWDTASLVITPVNDAPALVGGATLNAITEDSGAPTSNTDGTAISSLVGLTINLDSATNVDEADTSPALGIAVTAFDSVNYSSWYVYDGSVWTAAPSVSDSQALLLPASGSYRLYGVPRANVSGSLDSAITFRAWDQTSGTSGSLADTTTNGGSTAFSSATSTMTQSVTAVNDAPVLDSSKSPAMHDVAAGSGLPTSASFGTSVSELLDSSLPSGGLDNITDNDSGALLGLAVVGVNETDGVGYYSTDSGASWAPITFASESHALLLSNGANVRLYYRPNSSAPSVISDAFTIRAWDQSSDTEGSYVSIVATGTDTAYSAASDTVSIQLTTTPSIGTTSVSTVKFRSRSKKLSRSYKAKLAQFVHLHSTATSWSVSGYASGKTRPIAQRLANRRAGAIKAYLRKLGVRSPINVSTIIVVSKKREKTVVRKGTVAVVEPTPPS